MEVALWVSNSLLMSSDTFMTALRIQGPVGDMIHCGPCSQPSDRSSGKPVPLLQTLEADIRKEVDESTKKAKADKEIGLDELTTDIYADPIETTIRGTTPWDRLPHKSLKLAVNL
uniref:Uncharacterized protein n=1 Tax=Timema douglasi TaxID=61478 RepID=A0A7R8VTW6_TIMDO|nr:unnamed protein product [Timema douglasi]